ncbi:MAG: beta-N-acetylhexosaminidase [Clostridia bacterium]|nr:beta-N-acetylhexosaminidase [Clostridia bacterium]
MANGYFTAMLDCSRNGVIKVNRIKDYIDILAKFGYNALELYTEDTFEIEGEPYFGFMRGGYSKKDLKELNAYALSKGIELIPCVQTLAHLNGIFKWHVYSDVKDTQDILLVDEEKTYNLIEKIISTARECFSSKKIHIGMDEAELVGLGNYLKKHGYKNRFELLNRHLQRVVEIAKKYNFEPCMWSDMFFKIATGEYCLNDNKNLSLEVKNAIPSGVDLVYWWYYDDKEKPYLDMLKIHKELNEDCWFAGAAWSWSNFAPFNKWSMKHLSASLNACRKTGVKNILITVWGDDGQECSHFAVLSSLFYAIKTYQGEKSIAKIKKEFYEITGENFNAFLDLDLPNSIADNVKAKRPFGPSKYGFYGDLLSGYYDLYTPCGSGETYKKYAYRLKKHAKQSKNYGYLFEVECALCDFLSVKFELAKRLRKAYKENDLTELETICKDIKRAERKLDKFEKAFKTMWNNDYNPQGYDVQDIRIGALKQRLKTAGEKVRAYLDKKVLSVPELEETNLPLNNWNDELLGLLKWKDIVSVNVISHNVF